MQIEIFLCCFFSSKIVHVLLYMYLFVNDGSKGAPHPRVKIYSKYSVEMAITENFGELDDQQPCRQDIAFPAWGLGILTDSY